MSGESEKLIISGNSSAAYGAKIARAQVIAAYPITPQTTIVEKIAEFIAKGEYNPQFVKVESEHSAMAACIAASQTGARTFTATSAHGLALMHEMLHWAAAARLPVVMSNVCRAMGPPWSVWADHTDAMSQRDTGWMQIYAESNQETLDNIIISYRIAEKSHIMLPFMINEDAFILSHTYEIVHTPPQDLVDAFLPSFDPPYKLDPEDPHGFGSLSMPHQWYMELRYKIAEAAEKVLKEIQIVGKEYGEIFGRYYDLLDLYECEDAEVVLVGMGTVASTAKDVVDDLRAAGKKVGFCRIRVFRPFPVVALRKLLGDVKMIGVMDRSFTFGYEGPLFTELKSALYGKSTPLMKNYVVGIGGRDVTPKVIRKLYDDAYRQLADDDIDIEIQWIDLKGEQRIHERRDL